MRMITKLTTKQELTLLRSAVTGLIGKDKEGNYQPDFVLEMLASTTRKPSRTFSNPNDFLKQVASS